MRYRYRYACINMSDITVKCVSRMFDRNSYENIVKEGGIVYCTPWSIGPYMHTNF
jgi:hypothetical protein